MKYKRIIKKVLLIGALSVLAILGGSILATILYKDELISHFIREANKQLATPINVEKIHVSAFKNFPQITLSFDKTVVKESYKHSNFPLLEAESIEFTFNPIAIYQGDYTVGKVRIKNGFVHLKVNKQGYANYDIFKKSDSLSEQGSTVKLDISDVVIKNVYFQYSNDEKENYISTLINDGEAEVQVSGRHYDIEMEADLLVNHIISGSATLFEEKDIAINTELKYDDEQKHLHLNSSDIYILNSQFVAYGDYRFLKEREIEMYVEGEDTDIQTIISLLPEKNTQNLQQYRSKGDVYFDLALKGKFTENTSPQLDVNFGLIDSKIYHPETGVEIENANSEGSFHAGNIHNISKSTLRLTNIHGTLEGKSFSGALAYEDFDDPYLKLAFNGDLDVNSMNQFYPNEWVENSSGTLSVDINLEGKINDLKKKATAHRVKTSGEIDLSNVNLELKKFNLPVKQLEGNLLFNNNDLAISDVRGYFGKSDFKLNGFFKNIVAFFLFDDEPIGIESDLVSNYIDLDELLAENKNVENQSGNLSKGNYTFFISPRLMLKFNCDVKKLHFRRFKPCNIKGALKIKQQIAFTDQLKFNSAGGEVALSGMADASNDGLIRVNTSFGLNGIDIDSAFYIFENFNQSFLKDKHLKGQLMADVEAEMVFTDKLKIYPETLTANISTSIKGGQLNNFEPMQKLAKYVDANELNHLVFSELRNDIHIENKTIYLPQMEVSSNVTTLKISGTHTFDQKIDYRVVTPLRNKEKIDRDAAYGAIEETTEGRSMLYLKIVGATSDYRVVYDKDAVKEKIISDIKKEAQELKDAFKNKGLQKKQTIELEEDDYFDWNEEG